LHGLPRKEVPEGVDDCVVAIQQAGECAEEHGEEAELDECEGDQLAIFSGTGVETACDLVRAPQDMRACGFLRNPGAAGAAGATGD
jgi:hypothetical protein